MKSVAFVEVEAISAVDERLTDPEQTDDMSVCLAWGSSRVGQYILAADLRTQ